jgi:hypothetical protein
VFVEHRVVVDGVCRDTSLPFGSLYEVLSDLASFVLVTKEEVPAKVLVKTKVNGKWRKDFVEGTKEVFFRSVLPPADWMETRPALGLVAEACGLRRLVAERWRMLAPNAVLHPQFGPGVTIATDGVWVILWSKPWEGADWLMAHRSNVVGPVTSTPTALWEWAGSGRSKEEVRERRRELLASL